MRVLKNCTHRLEPPPDLRIPAQRGHLTLALTENVAVIILMQRITDQLDRNAYFIHHRLEYVEPSILTKFILIRFLMRIQNTLLFHNLIFMTRIRRIF